MLWSDNKERGFALEVKSSCNCEIFFFLKEVDKELSHADIFTSHAFSSSPEFKNFNVELERKINGIGIFCVPRDDCIGCNADLVLTLDRGEKYFYVIGNVPPT